ncbi:MAG TPA: hypothetical protein PLW43_06310 [Chitinophagales bacterium]|nr:hypothetical protein [Chitinophagales bacterium]
MNKMMKKTGRWLLAISCIISACSKTEDNNGTLTVITAAPSDITQTTAVLGGNVTDDGGNNVTEKGICLSDEPNPTITDPNDIFFEMGSGLGAFSDTYEGFEPNATYYVRAYAINSSGTSYGESVAFTTGESEACSVVSLAANANITTNTTWTAGNVYVLDGWVTLSATLTIEPGVVVKFKPNARLNVNSGQVLAEGTAENRIVFTSYKDDNYCGDTNGDGDATSPAKGDWTCVYLNGGNDHMFTYCDFFYAGANDNPYNNAVRISVAGSSFTFDHCVFAHTKSVSSNSASYAFYGGFYMNDNSVSVFTNNVFYDNDRPIYLDVNYNFNPSNSFSNPLNPSEKNTRNAIWTYTSGKSNYTTTYSETEVPYVIDGYYQGALNHTFNIGANVVVKFSTSAGLKKQTSRPLNINASAILTSIKDDTYGGDTNGDGNASSPAKGDWDGIWNGDTQSYMSGANILYADHP